MIKNLSIKYGQKCLDSAKKSTADAVKTASKRAIQKTEATGDLIGNKIADKITNVSKKSSARSEKLKDDNINDELEAGRTSPKDILKKRYISPEEKQQIIDVLRLVYWYNNMIMEYGLK